MTAGSPAPLDKICTLLKPGLLLSLNGSIETFFGTEYLSLFCPPTAAELIDKLSGDNISVNIWLYKIEEMI